MKTLTIGQLANLVGMSVEAVRFYEREGLLDEAARGASGYRKFPTSAVERVKFIQRAQHLGFTLREIKNLLVIWKDRSATHEIMCRTVDQKVADLEARGRELLEKAESLTQLCNTCRMSTLAQGCPVMRALLGAVNEGEELPMGVPTPDRCRANHGPLPESY